jgi:hypothetical protein
MKHSGHYYHAGCMSVEVRRVDKCGNDAETTCDQDSMVTGSMRDFAKWIYATLEKEHGYRWSDECVDENIKANEYEFTEDGARA